MVAKFREILKIRLFFSIIFTLYIYLILSLSLFIDSLRNKSEFSLQDLFELIVTYLISFLLSFFLVFNFKFAQKVFVEKLYSFKILILYLLKISILGSFLWAVPTLYADISGTPAWPLFAFFGATLGFFFGILSILLIRFLRRSKLPKLPRHFPTQSEHCPSRLPDTFQPNQDTVP